MCPCKILPSVPGIFLLSSILSVVGQHSEESTLLLRWSKGYVDRGGHLPSSPLPCGEESTTVIMWVQSLWANVTLSARLYPWVSGSPWAYSFALCMSMEVLHFLASTSSLWTLTAAFLASSATFSLEVCITLFITLMACSSVRPSSSVRALLTFFCHSSSWLILYSSIFSCCSPPPLSLGTLLAVLSSFPGESTHWSLCLLGVVVCAATRKLLMSWLPDLFFSPPRPPSPELSPWYWSSHHWLPMVAPLYGGHYCHPSPSSQLQASGSYRAERAWS